MENKKKLSLSMFVLILICFALPFVCFSCGGENIATLSGLDLVTGGNIGNDQYDADPWAIATLIAAVIGIGFSLLKGRGSKILSFLIGSAGFISLMIMKTATEQTIQEQGEGMISVQWLNGFNFAVILFAAAAIFNIIIAFSKDKVAVTSGDQVVSTPLQAQASPGKFCPQCGCENSMKNGFCEQCGAKLMDG